jgi:hypothetical protein
MVFWKPCTRRKLRIFFTCSFPFCLRYVHFHLPNTISNTRISSLLYKLQRRDESKEQSVNITYLTIFASQGLPSAPLPFTLGRLSQHFVIPAYRPVRPPKGIGVTGLTIAQGMLNTIFASQGLRSAPLLFTIGRLSRNFGSSRFILLFDAAVGDCIQSKCV